MDERTRDTRCLLAILNDSLEEMKEFIEECRGFGFEDEIKHLASEIKKVIYTVEKSSKCL